MSNPKGLDTRVSDALRAILITATDATRIQNFVRPLVEVALELEQQVESLRAERDAEKERLDWFIENCDGNELGGLFRGDEDEDGKSVPPFWFWECDGSEKTWGTPREAIDAARKSVSQEPAT